MSKEVESEDLKQIKGKIEIIEGDIFITDRRGNKFNWSESIRSHDKAMLEFFPNYHHESLLRGEKINMDKKENNKIE